MLSPLTYNPMSNNNNDEQAAQKLKKAATQLENMFVSILLKQANKKLFSDEKEAGVMSSGYQDMVQEQLSQQIAKANALGIARIMQKALQKGK